VSWRLVRGVWRAAPLLALVAACADSPLPRASPRPERTDERLSSLEYGFLLRTDGGDTVAIERVRRGATWRDAHLWLPRRGERARYVLQHGPDGSPVRWDLLRERGAMSGASREPETWRVHVAADSLFVTQGAVIGAPFTLRALAAPRHTVPWHDASGALLEEVVKRARQSGSRLAAPRTATTVHIVGLPNSDVLRSVQVELLSGDSLLLRHANGDWRLAVSRDGQVLGGVAHGRRLRLSRIPSPPDTLFDVPLPMDAMVDTASYDAQEVVLRASDGVILAGTFTSPRDVPRAPAVLLVSGAGPQDRNLSVPGLPDYRLFAALADTLARRGVAVLRLDDRGTGRSGGVAYSATASDEIDDVGVALAWLRARENVRADRLALVGHSDGGLTVLHAAEAGSAAARHSRVSVRDAPTRNLPRADATSRGLHPRDSLRALVLMGAPSRSGRELARLQRRAFLAADSMRFPSAQRLQTLARLDAETERMARVDPWLRDWLAHDPRAIAWGSLVPVLLVHGERDQQVPVVQADELAVLLRRGGVRDVQLVPLPGVNHLLVADSIGDPRRYRALRSRAVSAQALGPIVQWLLSRLGRSESQRRLPAQDTFQRAQTR